MTQKTAALYVHCMATRPTARLYLREWRNQRGLTQQDLADATGLSRTIICRYETGARRIHLDALSALAAALGLRAGHLLDEPPPPPDPKA